MDKIKIKDLECYAYHGVLESEQKLGQKFYVSVTMHVDNHVAARQDDLQLSVDYSAVCTTIQDYMKQNRVDLIETVAEQLAEKILLEYSLVQSVDVIVKKPSAPIPMAFETVQVEISRGWHLVYLGVGANLGDKKENIRIAMEQLLLDQKIRDISISQIYATEPYGMKEQDDFLNAAIVLKTLYMPEELLQKLHQIESYLHRERVIQWGPRTIDLDILFYDQLILWEPHLTIPHVEVAKRDFVLVPLCDLNGYLQHPVTGKTVKQMYEELQKAEEVQKTIKYPVKGFKEQ